MINFRTIDDITRKLSERVPENVKMLREDMEANFKAVLSSAFERMDLVTREEFEAQKKVLERTWEKLEMLELTLEKQRSHSQTE